MEPKKTLAEIEAWASMKLKESEDAIAQFVKAVNADTGHALRWSGSQTMAACVVLDDSKRLVEACQAGKATPESLMTWMIVNASAPSTLNGSTSAMANLSADATLKFRLDAFKFISGNSW
jgi:hypothetical protein